MNVRHMRSNLPILPGMRRCTDTSDLRHFGPRIKICFECVKNVDPLYIRYSDGMEVFGKRLTKVVSDV